MDPLVEAIRFAYRLERRNADRSIPWDGLEVGREDLAVVLGAEESLERGRLRETEAEQGRDPLVELVSLAVRLGMEQGRRVERSGPSYKGLEIRARAFDAMIDRGTEVGP